MTHTSAVPSFALYGETAPFPDVVHCERYSARAEALDWKIRAHRHGQMVQLFLIAEGCIDAVLDGDRITLRDGDFLFVPAHCVHEFVFEPGTTGDVISIPTSVVASVAPAAESILSALSRPIAGRIGARLGALAGMLKDVADAQVLFRAPQAVGLAHTVLSHLAELSSAREDAARGTPPRQLVALEALIKRHLPDGWSASDYARALSVSTGHLSRLCRRATGQGAAAYIEHKRMDEACRMLAFTQLPVSEVGYRLGYGDPSHFSKRFRAARQQTPTGYRETVKGRGRSADRRETRSRP